MPHQRQIFLLLYLPQSEVLGDDICREQIGQLVVADAEEPGQLADLDIHVLPLQLGHRGVPVDEFPVIDGG